MLKQMRERAKTHRSFLLLVIGAVLFSFILMIILEWGGAGAGGSAPQANWAAKVGDTVISADEYKGVVAYQDQYLRSLLGAQYNPDQFLNPNGIAQGLIDQALLGLEAQNLGLGASKDEIARDIRETPTFLDSDGTFNRLLYEGSLTNRGLQAKDFEARIARDIAIAKLDGLMRTGITVDESAVRKEWLTQNETATIEYVLIESAGLSEGFEPSEADLRARFDADPTAWDGGPGRLVSWATIERSAFQASLENEADMRAYYEENKSLYSVSEADRRASRILISVAPDASDADRSAAQDEAQQLTIQAVGGADFAALALEHSDDDATKDKGGDLGPTSRGVLDPALEAAIWEMAEGDVRGPIETSLGYEVVKLTKGAGESARSFEEVRGLVSKSLYGLEAATATREALSKLQAAYDGGASFEEAASQAGVPVAEPTWVTRASINEDGPLPAAAVAAAFQLQLGEKSSPITTEDGQIVLNVQDLRDESPLSFDEARDQIADALRTEKAMAEAVAEAEIVLADVMAGGGDLSLAGADRVPQTAGPFRRGQYVGALGLAEELNEQAFSGVVGEFGPVTETTRGAVIYKLIDRIEFDQEKFDADRGAIEARLNNRRYQALRTATVQRLRDRHADIIQRNDAVINFLAPTQDRSAAQTQG